VKFVEIQNVTKRFSNHLALNKISFSINKGVVFGLLGPNGAGKTTLIRILNQITAPDSGTILFEGHPIKRTDIERIGYLPEERGLYKKMKVGEQALYLAQLKGLSKEEAIKRLHYWFKKFEISIGWNAKVEELSKGMQQKVQFITTIIHQPEFLIFDEPFSGFDPINANLMKEEILELKKKGATIILSTHNMASVEEICDDIVLINNAEIILDGNLAEIKTASKLNQFQVEVGDIDSDIVNLLPTEYEILGTEKMNGYTLFTMKISQNATPNQLLQFFIGHASVHSFKEILPSMNEIFIDKVNSYNKSHQHE
jgi:ABC-2 type transport system ATP-binding protein